MPAFESLNALILALAITVPRIAAAFVVLPLLGQEMVPALVRNSIYVGLALVVTPFTLAQMDGGAVAWSEWPFLLIKEILIGGGIGLLFASVFWAISVAGGVIDTQIGNTFAQLSDPIQGHQSSINQRWLTQLATWLFMASGGFLVFLDLLLGSYRIWPVSQSLPTLNPASIAVFAEGFRYLMTAGLLLAAPVIVVLFLIDLGFGIVNKFAQQLNLLTFSMPIKSVVGTFILLLNLGIIVELVLRKIAENRGLLETLRLWFS